MRLTVDRIEEISKGWRLSFALGEIHFAVEITEVRDGVIRGFNFSDGHVAEFLSRTCAIRPLQRAFWQFRDASGEPPPWFLSDVDEREATKSFGKSSAK